MSTVNNEYSVGNKILLQTENITEDNREKALFKIIALIKYRCKEHEKLKKLVISLKNIKKDYKFIIDNEFADNINLYKIFDYHILNISQNELGIAKTFYEFFESKGLLSDEYLSDDKNNVIFKLNISSENDANASYIILKKNSDKIGIFYINDDIDKNIIYEEINTRIIEKTIHKYSSRHQDTYSSPTNEKYKYLNISINKLNKAEAFNDKIIEDVNVTQLPAQKNDETYGVCLDNIIMFLYDNLKTREKRNEYKKYLIDITTNMENNINSSFEKIENDKLAKNEKQIKKDGFYQLNIDDLTNASIEDNITFLHFFTKYNLAEEIYDGIIFKIDSTHNSGISSIFVILIYRMEKYSIYEIDENDNFVSCKTNEPFKYSGNILIEGPGLGMPVSTNIKSDFNNISINNKYLADTYNKFSA
jgi:hypothetical protein